MLIEEKEQKKIKIKKRNLNTYLDKYNLDKIIKENTIFK